MNTARLARALLGVVAIVVPGCYWLASYRDLSSDFGDAGALDSGPVVDAGPVADAARPFCPVDAGPLVYCMDFDGVDANVLDLTASGAQVAIVNTQDVSPPSSLGVALGASNSFGRYQVPFPFEPTRTTLQFQMQPNTVTEGTTTAAITLLQASTQTARTLNVVVNPNGGFQVQEFIAMGDGGTQVNAHALHQVDAGLLPTWHPIILTLNADDANGGTYTSSLSVDGEALEAEQPLALPWAQGTVRLDIGVTFSQNSGSQLYFDNVRADFEL